MTVRRQRVLYVLALVLDMAVLDGCNRAGEPPKPDPIPVGDYTYAGDLAAHRVEALMEQYHMPGAAAALIDDQGVVWQGNFGLAEIASGTPVTNDTIFKLWSLSKPFTALLFYPTIGFVVEILFHILPLSVLLVLATSLFKSLTFDQVICPYIFIVALLEPIFQTIAGYSQSYPWWVMAVIALHIFLLNIVQLALFKRYDFLTMYSFRLIYYLLWHIIWGVMRLPLFF